MNNTFGYIIIDDKKRIVDIWSVQEIFGRITDGRELIPLDDATDPKPYAITNENGIPLYRWNGEKIVKRTDKAIASDTNPINIPPEDTDLVNAPPSFEFSDVQPDTPPLLNGGD